MRNRNLANCADLYVGDGNMITVCPLGYVASNDGHNCVKPGWPGDQATPIVVQELGAGDFGQCVVAEGRRGYWRCDSSGNSVCSPSESFAPPFLGDHFTCGNTPLPASSCKAPSY